MPEGVEVKALCEHLSPRVTGKKITGSLIISGKYSKADGRETGIERLSGLKVLSLRCKGKLIVFNFGQLAALSTLGMTGWWVFNQRPKHARLSLELNGKEELVYVDQRNFGNFKVVDAHVAEEKLDFLGADILQDSFSDFERRLNKYGKKRPICEVLLDQRVAAGCGNYIRADALYLAEVSPFTPSSELSDEKKKLIWESLQAVGKTALEENGAYQCITYGRARCPRGTLISRKMDGNGRTIWWSPDVQK